MPAIANATCSMSPKLFPLRTAKPLSMEAAADASSRKYQSTTAAVNPMPQTGAKRKVSTARKHQRSVPPKSSRSAAVIS